MIGQRTTVKETWLVNEGAETVRNGDVRGCNQFLYGIPTSLTDTHETINRNASHTTGTKIEYSQVSHVKAIERAYTLMNSYQNRRL